MSLVDVQSRNLAPVLGGVGASAPAQAVRQAISGNSLMGMDVWGGASAAERSLGGANGFSGNLEQMVNHILAPLG